MKWKDLFPRESLNFDGKPIELWELDESNFIRLSAVTRTQANVAVFTC